MQLSLADRTFEPQQEPVIERAGVIEPVEVTDHSVSHSAQIEQPVSVGIVSRNTRDVRAEHQSGMAKRDLRGQPPKPLTVDRPIGTDP